MPAPYRMQARTAGRWTEVCLALELVLAVEALDPTCGVDDVLLAREERVRCARDVQLDQRVLVSVFPLNGLVRLHGRASQEGKVC